MTDFYVNPTSGNDSTGDGSSGNPYKTFAHVDSLIVAGDNIFVADGAHVLSADDEGIFTAAVNISSVSGNPVLCSIDSNSKAYTFSFRLNGAGVMKVEGIKFIECYPTGFTNGVICTSVASGAELEVNNCIFKDCRITTHNKSIVQSTNTTSSITVDRCVFDGIDITANWFSSAFISTNRNSASDRIESVSVSNSTFIFQPGNSNLDGAICVSINNAGSTVTADIKNCIFINNGSTANMVAVNMGNPANVTTNLSYSCTHNNGGGGISVDSDVTQSNMISDNPLFVDLANEDYRLSLGSPCIGTGTST